MREAVLGARRAERETEGKLVKSRKASWKGRERELREEHHKVNGGHV